MIDWSDTTFEVRVGPPGHGGFCVARHEGRVVFVRHALPGELVRVRVTEDRGGSFCRADAIDVLESAPDRVPATCPVSGPGGAGCCDFSHATPEAQRALKASVVAEQLRRLAGIEREVPVESVPDGESGWRTRVRLVVDAEGRAGVHRYRSTEVIADLRCPQPVWGALDGIGDRLWTPGADLVVAVDGDGVRHIVELAPAEVEDAGGRRNRRDRPDNARGRDARPFAGKRGRDGDSHGARRPDPESEKSRGNRRGADGSETGESSVRGRRDRRGRHDISRAEGFGNGWDAGDSGRPGERRDAAARRAAIHAPREEWVVSGTGRAVEYVAGRRWEVAATGFWQAHRGAAQCYSDIVAAWADLRPGDVAWDLYSGAGVFAARLAEQVGPTGAVRAVESARPAVADGHAALRDLPWLDLRAQRVERWIGEQSGPAPRVVVLDPPRAGAGKEVIAAVTAADPDRIIHIGCDPAAFARDLSLYQASGYRLSELRAFDAFPATHHVECLALLER
ncbi:class I SAM-dependent RNA methyltransferase [Nocardia panacis]|uniref:Class I SAM-dependent RNA methyltransferase n=1 Tax=Nocardia panacis TaxID=2340916 RepID=A0A3A4KJ18_9NOCA|nr:TRAM domain-containing protein [Nocardia panacis]RJO72926.1 class I SAM-dependent RNA methyltransferase [Nocardia panacis]